MAREFRINNFDLLRIVAASQVMLFHILLHLNISAPTWLIELLYAFPGVPIFFVISGFLIAESYERSSSLKSYCRNRALRIFPGLWCCILVTVVAFSFFGVSFANAQAIAWIIAQFAGVIYTPGLLQEFGVGSYNGSLWTIPVELQFYVLVPVLYWLTRKATNARTTYFWLVWLAFTAIAVVTRVVFPPLDGTEGEPMLQKLVRYSFVPHFFLFMTGVTLQRLKVYELKWIAGKGVYWLAGYLAFYYATPETPILYVPAMLLLGVAVVSMAYTAPTVSRRLLKGNDLSYGVYIYHGLLINLFVEMGRTGSPEYRVIAALVIAACACLAAYVSWVVVEKPFLRRKKQTISPTLVIAKPQLGPAAPTAN